MSLASLDDFEQFLEQINFRSGFWGPHYLRYTETFKALLRATELAGGRQRALELGTSWVFATYMKSREMMKEVDVTDFSAQHMGRSRITRGNYPALDTAFTAFSLDLESDKLPVENDSYDLVVCCELLEHLDVDPMFMMCEINRCLKKDGVLLLTTPNSISSQIVKRILHGYSPQFYIYYQKDRRPFRHNFEYAPHQLRQLLECSGLEIINLWTANTFAEADSEALEFLEKSGFPTADRGDNLFAICRKSGPIVDRYPNQIYDTHF